jgi:DNA-binding transcriptional LysR family regulator
MEMIEIEAFVTIATAGSFTRAAEELHISQPAVSRRIDLLERELGAPLFERVPGGARLTEAGEAFLPFARQVLAATRDGIAAVRELDAGEAGTVTLALVGTLASTRLTDRLRAFRETYPGIRLLLRTARSDEVSRLVQQGEVSLGLRYFPDPSAAVVSAHVEDEDLVVVCASHVDVADVRQPEGLAGVPWVGFPPGAGSSGEPFTRVLERQLASVGLDDAEIVAIDSLTAQKRLIEAGFGLGLLPASSIIEEVRLGTLRILPIPALATTVPVFAIHRKAGYLGPATRRLLATLTGTGAT